MYHPRRTRFGGRRRYRQGARGAPRARPLRYRPGRRRDRRPRGGGGGHRRHRRSAGPRGALARRGPHPRQGRPRGAGQGAQERPGFALRPADGRSPNHRGRGQGRPRRPRHHRRLHDRRGIADHDRSGRQHRPLHPGAARVTPARLTADRGRKIFLIATEESGDRLGANLMKVLRQRLGGAVRFEGVGGRSMAREGLVSRFPIEELSIIGLAAVVKQLPKILRLIRETAAAVTEAKPDILVIIDRPDFPPRVAKRVRPADSQIPIVDYVSPSVWAWRPGRARAMLTYVDHVLALLPFEPAAYQRLRGPPCSYVGHPLIEQLAALRPGADEQKRRDAAPPGLLVLPGSRRSEIRHHMAVFGQTLGRLRDDGVAFDPVLPTMPHLQE